ncbi:MAG: universal stress protein [Bacteroidetes bacterium]|nr:MAG: universal stress protein [Bacteroidota bacterium]
MSLKKPEMKTKKIEKVLIALDFDPSAQKVADSGYLLAKAMDAEVVLLHIISDPVFYSSADFSPITGFGDYMGMVPMQSDNIEAIRDASMHFLEKIKKHLGDESIATVVEDGDMAVTIINTSKALHAGIIVMGSHSRKWLEDVVMGSVTREVLHHTTLPVYIIPTKKRS